MKVLIVLLAACVVGSIAQDCSAKFKDFHTCMDESRKKAEEEQKAKFEAMKPKLDACYTSNGCTPPTEGGQGKGGKKGKGGASHSGERHGNRTEGRECQKAFHEAMKQKFEECVKKAIPGFTFPPKDAKRDKPHSGERKGFNYRGENKALESCAKKQAVRDCTRALFNSSRPTEEEKRARFQARCDAKQKCQASLGAECQAQLEKFQKAACECRQQQHQQEDQIRAGIKACDGVEERKGTRPPNRDQKPESCDRKDYCKLGYDAFVKDHPKGQGKGGEHH